MEFRCTGSGCSICLTVGLFYAIVICHRHCKVHKLYLLLDNDLRSSTMSQLQRPERDLMNLVLGLRKT